MTRDDIIRMAKESGLANILSDWSHEFALDLWPTNEIPELERFAALVAAAEREACAKLAGSHLGGQIAAAIRARGQT
jgi:hypothetical protein